MKVTKTLCFNASDKTLAIFAAELGKRGVTVQHVTTLNTLNYNKCLMFWFASNTCGIYASDPSDKINFKDWKFFRASKFDAALKYALTNLPKVQLSECWKETGKYCDCPGLCRENC